MSEPDFGQALRRRGSRDADIDREAAASDEVVTGDIREAAASDEVVTDIDREAAPATAYGHPCQRSEEQITMLTKLMRARRRVSQLERQLEGNDDSDDDDSHDRRLDVAYSGTTSITALSNEHGLSRKSIRHAIQAVAYLWSKSVLRRIEEEQARLHSVTVELFVDKLKWDETKQVLVLHFSDLTTRDANRAAWPVMVSSRRLLWREQGDSQLKEINVACPPVILIGPPTADCFYDSLFGQHFTKRIERFIRFMRSKARIAMALREADADGKNVRMVAHELPLLVELGVLSSFFTCGLHSGNHAVGSTVETTGRSIVDALYAYGKLVRSGNFWARTVLGVEFLVNTSLIIKYEDPPGFHAEVLDTLIELFYPMPMTKDGKPPSPQAMQRYHDDVREFRAMCNGNPLSEDLVHYCSVSAGCGCVSPSHTKRRFAKVVIISNRARSFFAFR